MSGVFVNTSNHWKYFNITRWGLFLHEWSVRSVLKAPPHTDSVFESMCWCLRTLCSWMLSVRVTFCLVLFTLIKNTFRCSVILCRKHCVHLDFVTCLWTVIEAMCKLIPYPLFTLDMVNEQEYIYILYNLIFRTKTIYFLMKIWKISVIPLKDFSPQTLTLQ